MTMRAVLAVAAAALLGASAGCGNGDDGSDDADIATSSLTKAQFIKQANQACEEERSRLLNLVREYRSKANTLPIEMTPEYADLADVVFLPTFAAEVEAVRAIGAPSGDEEKVETMLEAQEEAIDAVPDQQVESFDDVEEIFGQASRLMLDYGIGGCSVGQPAGS